MKIHGKVWKYMHFDSFHEFAFVCYVLACILNVWTSSFIEHCDFCCFRTHPKRRAPKQHEFWRYSDLQIFYQDPIGDQNDGWSQPPKCQSN